MAFNQQDFNRFILDNDVAGLKETPITLKSGRTSYWYVNWREISSDVWGIDMLTDHILDFVWQHELEVDCFYGIPEGATKAAMITTYKMATQRERDYAKGSHALPMGRSAPKLHGSVKDRYFVGHPRGKTIALEDTTTTGDSLITGIKGLLEEKVEVVAAIGLTNRMERRDDGRSVKEAVEALNVPYFAMSTADDLLPALIRAKNPPPFVLEQLQAERAQYGLNPLKF